VFGNLGLVGANGSVCSLSSVLWILNYIVSHVFVRDADYENVSLVMTFLLTRQENGGEAWLDKWSQS
jgi:hypothetical protein